MSRDMYRGWGAERRCHGDREERLIDGDTSDSMAEVTGSQSQGGEGSLQRPAARWVGLGGIEQAVGRAPGDGDEFEVVVSCGRRPVACRPDGASIADQRTARTRGSREPAKSLSCAS